MKAEQRDELFMREALKLARKGLGHTSPNPVVGSVIIKDGKIVGKGYHQGPGKPHAEINAIRDAGELARDGELYVTLEPCNHYGRTPPCTKAIIDAGVRRVVVGMRDPNPHVTGGGCEYLRSKNIEVVEGILERECRLINQPFIKHTTTGIPYVTLKAALTLDGRLATRTGHSKWITNSASRKYVHRLRFLSDSVCVGIGTVIADDPTLNIRLYTKGKNKKITRIVLDRFLRISENSRLVKTATVYPLWIFHGAKVDAEKKKTLQDKGAHLVEVNAHEGKLILKEILSSLGNSSINSILVEGGSRVFGSFLENELVDEVFIFFAPKILGDEKGYPLIRGGRKCEFMTDALTLHDIKMRKFAPLINNDHVKDPDIMINGRLRKELY